MLKLTLPCLYFLINQHVPTLVKRFYFLRNKKYDFFGKKILLRKPERTYVGWA